MSGGQPPPSRLYAGLPPHGPRQRIGVFGGSFDPAHQGHRQASLLALRRLRLDQVWWLVTPGNPLKDVAALPPLRARMQRAAQVAAHPRIAVTGAETRLGTRYTADLLQALARQGRATRFVWIMGSDNLAQFHRWERWRDIVSTVPMAVVNRPGSLAAPLAGPAASFLRAWRVDDADAPLLASLPAPAWAYLTGPRSPASSTALRFQAASRALGPSAPAQSRGSASAS